MNIFNVITDQKLNSPIERSKFQPAIESLKNVHTTSSHRGTETVKMASRNNSGLSVLGIPTPEQLMGPDHKSYSIPT